MEHQAFIIDGLIMNNTSGKEYNIMDLVASGIASMVNVIVANKIMDSIYWSSLPRTPYYLRKRIRYLEYELIKETCFVNEEIIRP